MKKNLVDRHVNFYADDLLAAQARGIDVSKTSRELFHNFMAAPTVEGAQLNDLEREVASIRDQEASLIAQLRQKEALLADRKRKAEQEQAKMRAEIEERIKVESRCAVCGGFFSNMPKGSMRTLLKSGPHQNKYVCGSAGRGCFSEIVNDENRKGWLA